MGNQSRAENDEYDTPAVWKLGVGISPSFKYYHARKFKKDLKFRQIFRDDTRTNKNIKSEALEVRSLCVYKLVV